MTRTENILTCIAIGCAGALYGAYLILKLANVI